MDYVLNVKQANATKLFRNFIRQNDEKIFYLLGYAGTGKTYIVCKVIKKLLDNKSIADIYICAPTHQALNIIRAYVQKICTINDDNKILKFMTVHKLLNMKAVISKDTGHKEFRSQKQLNTVKLHNKIIVIDECSMISQSMADDLVSYIDKNNIKVIFLGDKKQLPPVNEKKSNIFNIKEKTHKYYVKLDEIMRTKHDDIMNISNMVRTWDLKSNLIDAIIEYYNKSDKKNIKLYHKKNDLNQTSWFKNFKRKLKIGTMPIILTWTNNCANTYSASIRHNIYNSEDIDSKYMPNDIIVFTNYYKCGDATFYTSDMASVKKIESETKKIFDWKTIVAYDNSIEYKKLIEKLDMVDLEFAVDKLIVEKKYSDFDVAGINSQQIFTISISDMEKYRISVNDIRNLIMNYYKHNKTEIIDYLWKEYYTNIIDKFAEINFGYATTTHKVQSATYDIVIMDYDDMVENINLNELRSLLYTGVTRAKNELWILLDQ